ncbi:hypothetical protein TruAng_000229 [Truncatella angustata]|nr:hypothetical protein TruAng_000229 [Truncatella angustata]
MSRSASAAIDELMIGAVVQEALQEVRGAYTGPWLLPRVTESQQRGNTKDAAMSHKRKPSIHDNEQINEVPVPYIPPGSHYLLGAIASQRDEFLKTAPTFDLMVLDPPWPSRSVRRKKNRYSTAYDMQDTRSLLSLIPIASHLKSNGLIAIWVTNKPAVVDLLRSPGGMFDQWDLESIAEWVWVKVTSKGVPVVDLESVWRKPWERLLIARKKSGSMRLCPDRKVIFGVPDLHSRKPNLSSLFKEVLPENYLALEVFSRNLTADWWSWGDQTLMFQQRHHWIEGTISEGCEINDPRRHD